MLSPAMRTGTVTKVSKDGLRVTVQYDELFRPPKTFHPNTLRLLMRAG